ncbi:hypothetical protein M405DRAFT_746773 [Rhizopogon salebrosus TDB-379]|nr:hypothetical protein M405DRAFT_746773 [Rhizopogon salebrosus TDB-379]
MIHYVQAIRDFGTTDNYNTEMFECFHIDCAKEAWQASNFCDEFPQMVQCLARQEKAALFESYLQHYDSGEDSDHQEDREAEIDTCDISANTARKEVIISQCPKAFNQPLHSIQTKHHCPSFSHHLRIYLNNFLGRDKRIPRNQLPLTILPFQKLNVWHAFKFPWDSLGNDVDDKEELDAVKAQPGRGSDVQARFDMVVVSDTDDAGNTEHLAYIEWYKLSARAGANHNMYLLSKPPASGQGITSKDIVPLKAITQSCQLIPHMGPNVTWPSSWKSHMVLDLCSSFVLNNWASKFSYQTMW